MDSSGAYARKRQDPHTLRRTLRAKPRACPRLRGLRALTHPLTGHADLARHLRAQGRVPPQDTHQNRTQVLGELRRRR
eukprot:scaffold247599_cov26-Tisochrysis_lutea.AAC.1